LDRKGVRIEIILQLSEIASSPQLFPLNEWKPQLCFQACVMQPIRVWMLIWCYTFATSSIATWTYLPGYTFRSRSTLEALSDKGEWLKTLQGACIYMFSCMEEIAVVALRCIVHIGMAIEPVGIGMKSLPRA
jgi:hypothetical protein